MRIVTVSIVLLLAVALAAVSAQGSGAEADIRAVLAAQQAAWNRADVARFMEGYEKSAELTFSGSSGVTRGWQNVFNRYSKRYPDAEAMGQLEFSEIEVRLVGPDAALVLGRFHLTRTAKAGGDASGHFSLVFRKTAVGWRIIHDHTS